LKHRKTILEREAVQKKFEFLARKRFDIEKKKLLNGWTFWTEFAIFVFALSIVPVLMITVILIWPESE
jgi:hypothetical protein